MIGGVKRHGVVTSRSHAHVGRFCPRIQFQRIGLDYVREVPATNAIEQRRSNDDQDHEKPKQRRNNPCCR